MKRLSVLLLIFAMLFSFAACGENTDEPAVELNTNPPETSAVEERENKIKIAAANDPMGLGFAKLSVDRAYAYDVEFCETPEEAIELFNSGKADVLSVSLDAAVKLCNESGASLQMLAINTLGMTYVLSNDAEIKTLDALAGKTVYCPSDDAAVNAIFAKLLEANGVSGVDVQYKTSEEIRDAMVDGTIDHCVLPEYKATGAVARIENANSPVVLANLWHEKFGFELAQGCIVARKDYVEKNAGLIEEFLGFYEASINYLNKNITGASSFLSANKFFASSDVAKAIISNSNIRFVSGAEMKELAEKNLEALASVDPEIISGAMPADDFYYGA